MLCPKFTNGTYTQFKVAIFKLYPRADGECKWTISDLDHLTGEWSRISFCNKEELGNYHRKFLVISGFLKSKNRMSENEVKRAFVRGFPMDFWNRVLARLQIKKPDTHPDDPWDVEDVYSATEFILHGSTPIYSSTTSAAPPTTTPVPDNVIKKEELFSILKQFSQTIARQSKRKLPPKVLVQDWKRDYVFMMAKITLCANAKLLILISRMGFANVMQITDLLFLMALQFYGLYAVTTWLNASRTGIPTILDVQKLQSTS